MGQGRSVRLFLVDGSPQGLITAEIMNWTGHVLTGPRTKLAELVQRPESKRTGIYFLVGSDPEGGALPLVYIGESDDVSTRLKQHNRTQESGGKDFWEHVWLVTSKDQNLTKAHVKYLESQLIRSVSKSGLCRLENSTAHEYVNLPESDQADMAFFIDQLRTILPVLGFEHLRSPELDSSECSKAIVATTTESPLFTFSLPTKGIKAQAKELDGQFVVLAGSSARGDWEGSSGGYENLYEQLCASGVLTKTELGQRSFTTDTVFSSPSAAAAVVAGRSANGRKSWVIDGKYLTYGAWQEQQLSDEFIDQ